MMVKDHSEYTALLPRLVSMLAEKLENGEDAEALCIATEIKHRASCVIQCIYEKEVRVGKK